MPRVLMIVRQFYPWVGGTERQAQKLAAKLVEQGIDVQVVTGRWSWGLPRREFIDNVPVLRHFTFWSFFGIRGLRKFGAYVYLLSLLWYLGRRRHDYDIVHVHMLSYPAYAGVLGARWWGKKSLVKMANSGAGSDIRRMRQNALIPGQRQMLLTALDADRMIAINGTIIDELQSAGVPAQRIRVIPNGVVVEDVAPKSDYASDEIFTLSFVGRLVPNKAVDVLLPAFAKVVRRRQACRFRLWLFGDGASRAALEELAERLGISAEVKFWGHVRNVSEHLEETDVFLLPSRTEGMSNALLEAMAQGLPAIATRIPGNVELLDEEENGLLVPPDDEASLSEAILRLVDDAALRQRLGQAARQKVESHYSIDSVARRYAKLYEELLATKAPASKAPVSQNA